MFREKKERCRLLNLPPPQFDLCGLECRFIPFFRTDIRVRMKGWYASPEPGSVVELDADYISGFVDVSGGWRPVFMVMRRSDTVGSPWPVGSRQSISEVKYINRKRYEPWVPTPRYEEQVAFYQLSLTIPRI